LSISGNIYPLSINNTLIDLLQDNGCEQLATFPTRLENTLDIFATNRPSLVNKCTPIPGISDHDIVLTDVNILTARRKPVARLIHLWKKADLESMTSDLTNFTTRFTSSNNASTPINNLWDTFKKECTAAINKHVPSKMTSTRYSQPWCNRTIRRLSRRKKRAYKRARKSNSEKDWTTYKTIQKATRTECKTAHNKYVHDLVTDDNSKKLYTFVKNKKCDGSGVAPLKRDGVNHVDPPTKAEILNDQFTSVFTKEDTESPLPDLGESPYPDAPQIHVTENGVRKLLLGINPNKATGPDSISPRFLKEMAHPLAPALTLIFQASLDQGTIPDDWKTANVTPIYKKGDKSQPSNYRPISLTSVACKLLEHVIHSSLMKFFEDHNILSQYQHGFRKHHSCESQLITTVNDLVTGLDKSQQIDAILLDFSKAFDKVPHQRLLLKLRHYGVRNNTLQWIQSFLSNRSQQVLLDGTSSKPAPVTSGVPQGTVLGPLLFLAYINDLPERVRSACRLFADDSLLYKVIKTQADAELLQEDLDKLQEWEKTWMMEFNASKCEVLRISNKRKVTDASYTIHGQTLQMTKKAKYLGSVLTPNMTWNAHIDMTTQKANNTLAFLRRNLGSCPQQTKEACYKSLVRPQVEYASTVWDPPTKALTHRVEMVQRRAARFVSGDYRRRSSVGSMIGSLGWDSLQQRRTQAKAVMMYRIVYGHVAIALPTTLQPQGALTRGHCFRYIPQYCRTQSMKTSFFPTAAAIWNQLPDSLVTAPSLDAFKSGIAAACR